MIMKHTVRKCIILFLIAFGLRAGYLVLVPQETILTGDATEYDTIAVNLARGNGYAMTPGIPTPIRAPAYPVLLAAVYSFSGHSLPAVRWVQALIGALTCLLIYAAGRKFLSERISFLGGVLLAAYPVLIAYTGLILSETLFTFFLAASMYFFARGLVRGDTVSFAGTGILLGSATLTRPTTILFPFLLAAVIFLRMPSFRLRRSLIVFVGFLFIVLPWTIRNYVVFQTVIPVATGASVGVFATGYMVSGHTWEEGIDEIVNRSRAYEKRHARGKMAPIVFDRQLKKDGREMIKHNIPGFLALAVRRLPTFWVSSHSSVFGIDRPVDEYLAAKRYFPVFARLLLFTAHGLLMFLAVAALFLCPGGWKSLIVPFSVIAYFSLHVLFDPCNRFALPAMPYAILMMSAALVTLHEKNRFFEAA